MNHVHTDVNYLEKKLKCLALDGTPKIGNRPLELLIEVALLGPSYSDSEAFSRNKMSERYLEILNTIQKAVCIQCKEFPSEKIHFTEKGVYCHVCKPTEPGPPPEEVPACIMNLLDLLEFPCKNVANGDGCKQLITRKTKREHEKTCSMNLKPCSIMGFNCEKLTNVMNQHEYIRHLLEVNKLHGSNDGVKTLQMDSNNTVTVTIQKDSFYAFTLYKDAFQPKEANLWCYVLKTGEEGRFVFFGKYIPESDSFQMSCISLDQYSETARYTFLNSRTPKGYPILQPVIKLLDCQVLGTRYFESHTHKLSWLLEMVENDRLSIKIQFVRDHGF